MEINWEQTSLANLAMDVSYGYTESANSNEVGPHFLRITDIQSGSVNWDDVPYCPIDDDKLAKYLLERGDIVVARTGNSTGENYIFTGSKRTVFASYLIRFRIDENRANPFFVWYCMRSRKWWEFVNSAKTGSAQAGANAKVLGSFPLRLPPISTQNRIVEVLQSLDHKIELNRQINQTLESMAQTLFKSWFVDFDPVIDNALAAGNEIPEPFAQRAAARRSLKEKEKTGDGSHPALPEDIRQVFPSAFQFTEDLGWIPDGWDSQSVYGVAKLINGASFKSKHFTGDQTGIPIIKIAEIKNGVSSQTKYTKDEFDRKYYVTDGDVLFSWSGNPDTSIDTFIWTGGPGWLNQHVFKVEMHSQQDRSYVYCLLKLLRPVFAEIARDKQTTGLGHVTAGDLKRLRVAKPSKAALLKFSEVADPILEKWFLSLQQNNLLGSLRDLLLPKLLSGELRIPDAEKLAAEAGA